MNNMIRLRKCGHKSNRASDVNVGERLHPTNSSAENETLSWLWLMMLLLHRLQWGWHQMFKCFRGRPVRKRLHFKATKQFRHYLTKTDMSAKCSRTSNFRKREDDTNNSDLWQFVSSIIYSTAMWCFSFVL